MQSGRESLQGLAPIESAEAFAGEPAHAAASAADSPRDTACTGIETAHAACGAGEAAADSALTGVEATHTSANPYAPSQIKAQQKGPGSACGIGE